MQHGFRNMKHLYNEIPFRAIFLPGNAIFTKTVLRPPRTRHIKIIGRLFIVAAYRRHFSTLTFNLAPNLFHMLAGKRVILQAGPICQCHFTQLAIGWQFARRRTDALIGRYGRGGT